MVQAKKNWKEKKVETPGPDLDQDPQRARFRCSGICNGQTGGEGTSERAPSKTPGGVFLPQKYSLPWIKEGGGTEEKPSHLGGSGGKKVKGEEWRGQRSWAKEVHRVRTRREKLSVRTKPRTGSSGQRPSEKGKDEDG